MNDAQKFNADMKRKNKIVWPSKKIMFFETKAKMEIYYENVLKKKK